MHRLPHVAALAAELDRQHGRKAICIASERLLSAVRNREAEAQGLYLAVCRLISGLA